MKRQFTIRPVFILFVLIVFTILKLVLYDQVISRPLNDYDEARYAEIAKNMIRTGEYLIPLAGGPQEPRNLPMTKLSNGEELYPFFWKPPAIVWLQAASMYVFGINEFASRIPSLLASIGLLIVLYKLFREYKIDDRITFPLLFAFSISYDFSFIATQGTTDALFCFFGTYVMLLAHQNKKGHEISAGVLTALALLTKSIAAFWIPVMYVIVFLLNKKFNARHMLRYFVSLILIAAPWFMFMYIRFGNVFIERHFLFNLMGGAENGQNFAPPQWYLIYMLDIWKPLIFFAPLIMLVSIEKILKNERTLFVPFWWFFSILIPFSLSQSKVWWYIYPLWPVFLLLIGLSLMHIKKNLWQSIFVLVILLSSSLPYWKLSVSHIPLKPFILFACAGAGILYLIGRYTKQKRDVVLFILAVLVTISAYFNYINFSRNPTQNTKIKNLAQRNQNLLRISILGIPYEAALYYFNVGNVVTSNTFYEQEKYVLYRKDSMPLELKNFALIDQEGDLFLYKHK